MVVTVAESGFKRLSDWVGGLISVDKSFLHRWMPGWHKSQKSKKAERYRRDSERGRRLSRGDYRSVQGAQDLEDDGTTQ